jgi:hypothetical protein
MFKKLLPLLFLFAGFQANATLIDNGDYSTDVESGLDWLDWTLTLNKTQAEALTQYGGAGWRVATAAEAVALMSNHFDVSRFNERGLALCHLNPCSGAKWVRFIDLFGATDSASSTFGLIGGSAERGWRVVGVNWDYLFANYYRVDHGPMRRPGAGVALVKVTAVSEPAIIALFSLGLVGIGFARKRQS